MKNRLVIAVIIAIILLITVIYYFNNNNQVTVVSSRIISEKPSINNLTIMTYNIHHGVGIDNRLDLDRIVDDIDSGKADIIGLNEVDSKMLRSKFKNQAKLIAGKLEMNYAFAPTFKMIMGSYGNALLTVFPIMKVENVILPTGFGHEPRGVLMARLKIPGSKQLSVLVTHLSLDEKERTKQLNWLLALINEIDHQFILMGDFNSESIDADNLNLIYAAKETYPTQNPQKKYDIFLTNCSITSSYTISTAGSDHLPHIVEIELQVSSV